jgi:hypothetical protein
MRTLVPSRDGSMVGRIGRMFDRNLWVTGRGRLAALVGVLALADGATAAGATPPAAARLAAATDAFAAAHAAYPGVALAVVSPRLHWTGSAGHPAFGSHARSIPALGFGSRA